MPSCVVAACDDELNVNVVLPPLCCSALPFGPFVKSESNGTVIDFLVPQFLSAALASPVCRDELLAMTQTAFGNLEATQRLVVTVYEGAGGRLPYCNNTCTATQLTQINIFLATSCAPFCPSQQ